MTAGPAAATDTVRQVYLRPGSLHCAAAPTIITTILGSCISVCLWDRIYRLGGMNHYVLPHANGATASPRYGEFAMTALLDGMVVLGCRIDTLWAKVFGGASLLPGEAAEEGVGSRNLQFGLAQLRHFRIPVVAQETGGGHGLRVTFDSASGGVVARRLNGADGGRPARGDGGTGETY